MSRALRRWTALQLLLAFAFGGLTGCGLLPSASLPPEGHAAPAETRVDAQKLRESVDWLAGPAQLGRLAGSPAGAAAADWIAGRFSALGLTPQGSDGFKQPFTFAMTRFVWPARLALSGVQQTRPYRYRIDFRLDPTSGAGSVSAPVIYVGYGLTGPERDDYQDANVRGKAVLFFRDCPAGTPDEAASVSARVAAAARRGAAAVLLIDRPDHLDWTAGVHPVAAKMPVIAVSPTVANDLFAASQFDFARVVAQSERGPVRPEILAGRAELEVNQRTEGDVRGTNVLGYLPGTDEGAGYYIVGAHFDHLGSDIDGEAYPGYADNASGVAVMLEVARVLAIDRPRPGILFAAFDAEEEGLYGSDYLAAHLPLAKGDLRGVINIDTIGSDGGAWRIRHSPAAAELAAALAQEAARLGATVELEAATGGSDEHSFAKQGLPALRLTDRTAPPTMHSTNEDGASVAADWLAKAAQAIIATIRADQGRPGGAAAATATKQAVGAPSGAKGPAVWQPSGAVADADGWFRLSTPHYTIRFRPGMKVSDDPAAQAEQIYGLLSFRFGSEPELPLTLVLAGDRAAQETAIRAVYPDAAPPITDAWVHYPSRTIVINVAGRDRTSLAQAIAHETAHLFAAGAMRRITETPWAREYLATYLERRVVGAQFGLTGWDSADGYRALLGQIKVQPWSVIAGAAAANADAAVEASSVYFFLEQQYGEAKLTEFWGRLLAEGDPERAFRLVYGKTSYQLEQDWRKFYNLK